MNVFIKLLTLHQFFLYLNLTFLIKYTKVIDQYVTGKEITHQRTGLSSQGLFEEQKKGKYEQGSQDQEGFTH